MGANNVPPVVVNNIVLYAAARGGHVRELSYSWQATGMGQLTARHSPFRAVAPIFTVGSLATAIDVVSRVGAPNSGILVDTLHLSRSGSTPAELAAAVAAQPGLVPYLQLADAPEAVPADRTALRDEALNGRLLCGDGVLPIDDVVSAVPGAPLSVELRSAALVQRCGK